ncbi:formylglycine-generating enzyme required for sulfatase activity [Actinoplanes tereljensis]
MAAQIGFHESVIALVERSERAPTPQYLERFAEALNLEGREVGELWRVYRQTPNDSDRPGVRPRSRTECPYRGLFAFREQDAALFHGRTVVSERVLSKLRHTSLVGVVGASGSGKSSVVYAGVIPRLRDSQQWLVASFRPGSRPFASLAVAMMPLLEPDLGQPALTETTNALAHSLRNGGLYAAAEQLVQRRQRPLLIFADQFEEVFTHGHDPAVVRDFLDAVVDISHQHGPAAMGVKVVLTLRGDFYGQVIAHRALSEALQDSVVHLPPMSRDELRSAITEPAQVSGITIEDGLVERILDEVGEEPGNLPLLEFSLMLLWDRQTADTLTHDAYADIGGIAGAIASQAEDVYTSLAPEQQNTARQLLTRLVRVARPNEDGNDTRRRTPFAELSSLPRVATVVAAMTDARLLVTDSDATGQQTVEVAHEAVIRSWNRLRAWLMEDRQFLLWQQRIRQWQQEWAVTGEEDGALLRGRILTEAENWLTVKGTDSVVPDLLEYVQRSVEARDRDAGEQALLQVDRLLTARPDEVPGIVGALAGHRRWVNDRLRDVLMTTGPSERWRVRLALLPIDAGQADQLIHELDAVEPHELVIITTVLMPEHARLTERLWERATDASSSPNTRFRAAVLLAAFDPDDLRWPTIAAEVADTLIRENQLHLREWVVALRPVRLVLLDPMQRLFQARDQRESVRESAAVLLLELADDNPAFLAQRASESMPQNFEQFIGAVAKSDTTADIARAALRSIVRDPGTEPSDEAERIAAGSRRAVAACSLLRLGSASGIADAFVDSTDPETITQFVHQARARGVAADLLVDLLAQAPTAGARYTILLTLGDFTPKDMNGLYRDRVLGDVLDLYRDDPDAGVHSACRWLLHRWDESASADKITDRVVPYDPGRGWFSSSTPAGVLTFAVYQPGTFEMGSPESELDRSAYESPRQPVELTRPFAVCTGEVTRGAFERFMADADVTGLPDIDEWSPLRSEPVVAATWFEAVHYCHWLTAQTDIGTDQQCYQDVEALRGQISGDRDDFDLTRQGYRLPTEAEWEYACRAGSVTPFSFGSDPGLLDFYGWSQSNSGLKTHAAGILRPNRHGLFNIHCNCWEWCLDWYGPYPPTGRTDPVGLHTGDRRVLRGGCWNLSARYGRSACRNAHLPTNRNYYIGFRVIRTLPPLDVPGTIR